MPLSLTPENKNSVSLTMENKNIGANVTWDEADFTWDDAVAATWDTQGTIMKKDVKNPISLTMESKQ